MGSEAHEVHAFVVESNKIENILRQPTNLELDATRDFLALQNVTLMDMQALVKTLAGANVRENYGDNVRVGSHRPPPGGPEIKEQLLEVLIEANHGNLHPYEVHHNYETLHPFMDGNGRSGRALWAWMMLEHGIHPGMRLGFLHCWYYQSLEFGRG